MQNAGLQFSQGAAPSQESTFDTPVQNNLTTSSTATLRQFRKKDNVDKTTGVSGGISDNNSSHVARVAPHNHYPPRTNDFYRFPPQYPDYNSSFKEHHQVKYSEIAEAAQPVPHVDHIPTVIQKHKQDKDYLDMCNIPQQPHLTEAYTDHVQRQQNYPPDLQVHHQYIHKDPQLHSTYKHESQYISKDGHYNQYAQIPKYNMQQPRKFAPAENKFISQLQRIHPDMARSIMNDHHLRESQTGYGTLEQNRMYSQNQRYYAPTIQSNSSYPTNYPHRGISQHYNYPTSCNYTRTAPINPPVSRYPTINMERSISPRRSFTENLDMSMNYAPVPQKIPPDYHQNYAQAYAQHYQQRRPPPPHTIHQEYYQQSPRAYLPQHQLSQEVGDSHVPVSNNLRQYIENWAEEENISEIPNQIDNAKYLYKEAMRPRDEPGEVFVINASDIPQYLENGVPLVTTENGQYVFKSNVSIDNNGAIKIVDKSADNQGLPLDNQDRVVSLHILENPKNDCLLNTRPVGLNLQEIGQNSNTNMNLTNHTPTNPNQFGPNVNSHNIHQGYHPTLQHTTDPIHRPPNSIIQQALTSQHTPQHHSVENKHEYTSQTRENSSIIPPAVPVVEQHANLLQSDHDSGIPVGKSLPMISETSETTIAAAISQKSDVIQPDAQSNNVITSTMRKQGNSSENPKPQSDLIEQSGSSIIQRVLSRNLYRSDEQLAESVVDKDDQKIVGSIPESLAISIESYNDVLDLHQLKPNNENVKDTAPERNITNNNNTSANVEKTLETNNISANFKQSTLQSTDSHNIEGVTTIVNNFKLSISSKESNVNENSFQPDLEPLESNSQPFDLSGYNRTETKSQTLNRDVNEHSPNHYLSEPRIKEETFETTEEEDFEEATNPDNTDCEMTKLIKKEEYEELKMTEELAAQLLDEIKEEDSTTTGDNFDEIPFETSVVEENTSMEESTNTIEEDKIPQDIFQPYVDSTDQSNKERIDDNNSLGKAEEVHGALDLSATDETSTSIPVDIEKLHEKTHIEDSCVEVTTFSTKDSLPISEEGKNIISHEEAHVQNESSKTEETYRNIECLEERVHKGSSTIIDLSDFGTVDNKTEEIETTTKVAMIEEKIMLESKEDQSKNPHANESKLENTDEIFVDSLEIKSTQSSSKEIKTSTMEHITPIAEEKRLEGKSVLINNEAFKSDDIPKETVRNKRIFSVDDIMNHIGKPNKSPRRSSLQFVPNVVNEDMHLSNRKEESSWEFSLPNEHEIHKPKIRNDIVYKNFHIDEERDTLLEELDAAMTDQLFETKIVDSNILQTKRGDEVAPIEVTESMEEENTLRMEDIKEAECVSEDVKKSESSTEQELMQDTISGLDPNTVKSNAKINVLSCIIVPPSSDFITESKPEVQTFEAQLLPEEGAVKTDVNENTVVDYRIVDVATNESNQHEPSVNIQNEPEDVVTDLNQENASQIDCRNAPKRCYKSEEKNSSTVYNIPEEEIIGSTRLVDNIEYFSESTQTTGSKPELIEPIGCLTENSDAKIKNQIPIIKHDSVFVPFRESTEIQVKDDTPKIESSEVDFQNTAEISDTVNEDDRIFEEENEESMRESSYPVEVLETSSFEQEMDITDDSQVVGKSPSSEDFTNIVDRIVAEEPKDITKNRPLSPEICQLNEIQYRSAIKIEENTVLLHIAGEFVEVNVNFVNGKKIITVVPLSNTNSVDFNDNHENIEKVQYDIQETEVTSTKSPRVDLFECKRHEKVPVLQVDTELNNPVLDKMVNVSSDKPNLSAHDLDVVSEQIVRTPDRVQEDVNESEHAPDPNVKAPEPVLDLEVDESEQDLKTKSLERTLDKNVKTIEPISNSDAFLDAVPKVSDEMLNSPEQVVNNRVDFLFEDLPDGDTLESNECGQEPSFNNELSFAEKDCDLFDSIFLDENEIVIGDENIDEEVFLHMQTKENVSKSAVSTKAAKKLYEIDLDIDVNHFKNKKKINSLREFRRKKSNEKSTDRNCKLKTKQKKDSRKDNKCEDMIKRSKRIIDKRKNEEIGANNGLVQQKKLKKEHNKFKIDEDIPNFADQSNDKIPGGPKLVKLDKLIRKKSISSQENVAKREDKLNGTKDIEEIRSRTSGDKSKKVERIKEGLQKKDNMKPPNHREEKGVIECEMKMEKLNGQCEMSDRKGENTSHKPVQKIFSVVIACQNPRKDIDQNEETSEICTTFEDSTDKIVLLPNVGLTSKHSSKTEDLANGRRKLSIQEYNNRKRKQSTSFEKETPSKYCQESPAPKIDIGRVDDFLTRTMYSRKDFETVHSGPKDPRRRTVSCTEADRDTKNLQMVKKEVGNSETRIRKNIKPLCTNPNTSSVDIASTTTKKVAKIGDRRKTIETNNWEPKTSEKTIKRKVSFDENVKIYCPPTNLSHIVKLADTKPYLDHFCDTSKPSHALKKGISLFPKSNVHQTFDVKNLEGHALARKLVNMKKAQNVSKPILDRRSSWEDSNSPTCSSITDAFAENFLDRRSNSSGLNSRSTKPKCIIDINDFDTSLIDSELSSPMNSTTDDCLQNYKHKVDTKLKSLNINIPTVPKTLTGPQKRQFHISIDDNRLMQRFLAREQLAPEEIKRITRIIDFKKKFLNETQNCHTDKTKRLDRSRRKKKRFRNLYTGSPDSTESELLETAGDYSVYQSSPSCSQAGVPKLIFKRKTELMQPFVRLERCSKIEAMAKKLKHK